MKKKRVAVFVIPAIIIVILAVWAVSYFFIKDVLDRKKLIDESDWTITVAGSTSSSDKQVNEALETFVATDKYLTVEKAARAYAKELYETVSRVEELVMDDELNNLVSPANIAADGKEFVKTKQMLSDATSELETLRDTYKKLMTETYALTFAESAGVDKSLIPLYTEATYGIITTKTELMENNLAVIDDTAEYLDVCAQIIDHLTVNSDKWFMRGNEIGFTDDPAYEKYNELLQMLG